MFVEEFQVLVRENCRPQALRIMNIYVFSCPARFLSLFFLGKQAVLVLTCDNSHMAEDVMVEPGLVMIFAHGIE